MNIYDLLDEIRRRPGMYIGDHSPTRLRSFIFGYCFALSENESKEDLSESNFYGFHDWVAIKYGYNESTSGWCHMIEEQRKCPEEALWLFYQLLDEYRNLHPQVFCKVENSKGFDINYGSGSNNCRPSILQIEEVLPNKEWVSLVAYNAVNEILDVYPEDDIDKAKRRAYEVFKVKSISWG